MSDEAVSNQAVSNQAVPDEVAPAQPAQLDFSPLPTMNDLDALQLDLDQVDRVLADLDNARPMGATPNPSQ